MLDAQLAAWSALQALEHDQRLPLGLDVAIDDDRLLVLRTSTRSSGSSAIHQFASRGNARPAVLVRPLLLFGHEFVIPPRRPSSRRCTVDVLVQHRLSIPVSSIATINHRCPNTARVFW